MMLINQSSEHSIARIPLSASMEHRSLNASSMDDNDEKNDEEYVDELEGRQPIFNIDEGYMQPPPTPSQDGLDTMLARRNMTIPLSSRKAKAADSLATSLESMPGITTPSSKATLFLNDTTNNIDETFYSMRESTTDKATCMPTDESISGFMILKNIGFAEMLYVTSFETKPSCHISTRNKLYATLSAILDDVVGRLEV